MLTTDFIHFKLLAMLIIFIMALVTGLLPWTLTYVNKRFFALGDAFADGIFLSIALFHMLPEAAWAFEARSVHYPLAYLLCLLVFVFLVFLEKGFSISLHASHEQLEKPWGPFLVILVLAIHSLLAGAALGVETSSVGLAVIFLAIVTHKGAAGFALGTYLQRHQVSFKKHLSSISVFSSMTPLGILLGALLTSKIIPDGQTYLSAVFLALASGTFLYIGAVHLLERPYFHSTVNYLSSLFSTFAGIILMALVAIWL